MAKPTTGALPARAAEKLRLLENYFELTEQEHSAGVARAQVRDRLLVLRAEEKGYAAGEADANRVRTDGKGDV
ncbi:MAG: hypothetical protein WA047_06715 [Phenylobacterium sp.]|uniref:hypothetical protein n=1 Tax=Phenylobacterium sp. TaxID=1871053 RepID=UPI003BB4A09E